MADIQSVVAFPWVQFVAPASAIIGGLAGAITNHMLSRGKHRSDKLWEKQVEVYSEIVSLIDEAIIAGDKIMAAYKYETHMGVGPEDRLQWTDEFTGKLNEATRKYTKSQIVLSPGFVAQWDAMREAVFRSEVVPFTIEAIGAALPLLSDALGKFIAQGQKDVLPRRAVTRTAASRRR